LNSTYLLGSHSFYLLCSHLLLFSSSQSSSSHTCIKDLFLFDQTLLCKERIFRSTNISSLFSNILTFISSPVVSHVMHAHEFCIYWLEIPTSGDSVSPGGWVLYINQIIVPVPHKYQAQHNE
jgi:hypothetical protein